MIGVNQEFPYVIAAITVPPSNWCHRANPCSTPAARSSVGRRVRTPGFFGVPPPRGLARTGEGGVERLKWHKLGRYLRQMRGWQYGPARRGHQM